MLEKAHSYKAHIDMNVAMMLQFSATKSPFAFIFARKHIICWAATQYHAHLCSTIQCVCASVCLCGRTSRWKKIHLQENKKKNILTCNIAVVRYCTLGHLYNTVVLLLIFVDEYA